MRELVVLVTDLTYYATMLAAARASAATSNFGRRAASTIALKYANAAYSAALQKSPQTLTKVQTELNTISKTLKDVPELKAFVTNPTLSLQERTNGIPALLAKVEGTGAMCSPVSNSSHISSPP